MINLRSYSTADFDRGASRFREMLWWIISIFAFRSAWPLPSILRRGLLRVFGARVGKRVVVRSGVHITFPWRLVVGDDVWIGEGVRILNLAHVTIQSNVCISQEAFLCTGSHDFYRTDFALKLAPIRVADGCWIAARAFIGPGVSIGRQSLVSAGSVLMKSAPAFSRVRGNPAEIETRRQNAEV